MNLTESFSECPAQSNYLKHACKSHIAQDDIPLFIHLHAVIILTTDKLTVSTYLWWNSGAEPRNAKPGWVSTMSYKLTKHTQK